MRMRLRARVPYCGTSGVSGAGVEVASPSLPSTYLVLEVVLAQVSGLGGPAISVGQSTLPE